RHTRCYRDWSSDVCSSDLFQATAAPAAVSVGPLRSLTQAHTFVEKFIGIAGSSSVHRFIIWATIGPRSFRASVVVSWAARRSYRSEERRVGKEWRYGGGQC